MVTETNEEQPLNASFWSSVTPSGITRDVKAPQPKKALSGMTLKEFGSVMLFKASQYEKAQASRQVLFGWDMWLIWMHEDFAEGTVTPW